MKSENIKYRFYIKVDHGQEYHVFETRYYAQKFIDEVLRIEYRMTSEFEISRGDDGFVIYEIRKQVL